MHQQYSVSVTLLLIIPLISAQLIQSPSDDFNLPRYVAQLSVRGYPIFVHDTGAPDGPHLAVEPLMCVTESPLGGIVRYDSLTKQIYVSFSVMVTDDAILASLSDQLRHVAPRSIKFATVSDISVSNNPSSVIQALGFVWTPDEAVGVLRIGCQIRTSYAIFDCLTRLQRFKKLPANQKEAALFGIVRLSSTRISPDKRRAILPFYLTFQNQSFFDVSVMPQRYQDPPTCKHLKFLRWVRHNQCTAKVHERQDLKGHFLIEPLLCHKITNMSDEYDSIRDMHYLNLNVVLQDETILNAVKSQLVVSSPPNVSFMHLWNAESHVASALRDRFEIGRLMVSGDGRSGQVRVYCKNEKSCNDLRREVSTQVFTFLKHIKWAVTATTDNFKCQIQEFKYVGSIPTRYDSVLSDNFLTQISNFSFGSGGKLRVTIQQRKTHRVSFQRNWTEYEDGFGDETDFWIGLNSIHKLSIKGAVTLRVDMKLWDGTVHYAEYDEFTVGDASTNYTMTYREMVRLKSDVEFDALERHKGMQFHTTDRDTENTCSGRIGEGGWWFNSYNCFDANPNGILPAAKTTEHRYVCWNAGSKWWYLKEVKLTMIITLTIEQVLASALG